MAIDECKSYRFADDAEGTLNLAHDERLSLLAKCVADQQRAGFKEYLDLRQFSCPKCEAPGFNTGWGVVEYSCGAAYFPDGGISEPCSHDKETI